MLPGRKRRATRTIRRWEPSSSFARPRAEVTAPWRDGWGGSLLDKAEHLVGIDVAPESPAPPRDDARAARAAVDHVETARVHVESGGRTVTLHGPFAKLVAPEAQVRTRSLIGEPFLSRSPST